MSAPQDAGGKVPGMSSDNHPVKEVSAANHARQDSQRITESPSDFRHRRPQERPTPRGRRLRAPARNGHVL
jgi:hypothetical protein